MSDEKRYEGRLRFGVVGILGYSRSHIGQIRSAQEAGQPVKLAAVLAYMREKNEKLAAELEAGGVKLVAGYDELLGMKDELDCITLPVGIPLHASMGIKALEAGFPVYLEKPVSGAIQDADALAGAEKESGKKLFIGYQLCFQPATWELKRRLLAGDVGKIRKIVVVTNTPRDRDYFRRNSWAGKLSINGTIVLDSPLNNANAHYMNLALFLAGRENDGSASPLSVQAELYMANEIESADTVSVRVMTEESAEIVWTGSHACENTRGPRIRIEGDRKVISVDYTGPSRNVPWREGFSADGEIFLEDNMGSANPFVQVARWLKGDKDARICDLKIARAQTLVVNGAHKAASVVKITDAHIKEIKRENGEVLVSIKGMDKALDACYEKGCMLSECGCAPWSVSPASADVSNLKHFDLRSSK